VAVVASIGFESFSYSTLEAMAMRAADDCDKLARAGVD